MVVRDPAPAPLSSLPRQARRRHSGRFVLAFGAVGDGGCLRASALLMRASVNPFSLLREPLLLSLGSRKKIRRRVVKWKVLLFASGAPFLFF